MMGVPTSGGRERELGAVVLQARPHTSSGRGVGLGPPRMLSPTGARLRATNPQAGAPDITLSYANPSGLGAAWPHFA